MDMDGALCNKHICKECENLICKKSTGYCFSLDVMVHSLRLNI